MHDTQPYLDTEMEDFKPFVSGLDCLVSTFDLARFIVATIFH